jgi:hypothetical protein
MSETLSLCVGLIISAIPIWIAQGRGPTKAAG